MKNKLLFAIAGLTVFIMECAFRCINIDAENIYYWLAVLIAGTAYIGIFVTVNADYFIKLLFKKRKPQAQRPEASKKEIKNRTTLIVPETRGEINDR